MVQADNAQVWDSSAGTLAVLADGIGRSNTGMVCAQIAVDTVLDLQCTARHFTSAHEKFIPHRGTNRNRL